MLFLGVCDFKVALIRHFFMACMSVCQLSLIYYLAFNCNIMKRNRVRLAHIFSVSSTLIVMRCENLNLFLEIQWFQLGFGKYPNDSPTIRAVPMCEFSTIFDKWFITSIYCFLSHESRILLENLCSIGAYISFCIFLETLFVRSKACRSVHTPVAIERRGNMKLFHIMSNKFSHLSCSLTHTHTFTKLS